MCPAAGPTGAQWGPDLGVVMHIPITTPAAQVPLALGPGVEVGWPADRTGCLSGRAAGAGDREDGVDHDTINLII